LNRTYFDGALASPVVLIASTSSPRALGDYCAQDPNGIASRIRISPRVADVSESYAADVLLHEMVHAWAQEVAGDVEPGYKGHGPRFAGKCNEIGAALGLSPVYARPRGKLAGYPDCAFWPTNVRPAAFYGPNDPRADHKPKADKPKAAPAPTPAPSADNGANNSAEAAEDEISELLLQLDQLRTDLADALMQAEREASLRAASDYALDRRTAELRTTEAELGDAHDRIAELTQAADLLHVQRDEARARERIACAKRDALRDKLATRAPKTKKPATKAPAATRKR